jgi:hypothetical protein
VWVAVTIRPMRRAVALSCLCAAAAAALAWACGGGNDHSPLAASDAGADSTGDDAQGDVQQPPPFDSGPTQSCHLQDGTDPVALCTEKQVLKYELVGAYTKGQGVAPSWDSATGQPGSPHAWQDDVGFASSIASYHCSAAYYGDTELTPQLDAALVDLAQVIQRELPQAPDGYDGEIYFRLRNAAAGLFYVNDDADAQAIAALADAFGRNLQTRYAQTVTWTAGGSGAGDAGAGDAAAADAGAGDATAADAGGGQTTTSTLIGAPAGNGQVVYAPAQSIMAAAALLDMAVRHANDADAGGDPLTWAQTAFSTLTYVWARGRDTTTGLFYQQLVTSSDPGHDALGQGTPTADALLTDVQATAILGLARAQDLAAGLPSFGDGGVDAGAPPSTAYLLEGARLADALEAASLWNGPTTFDLDAGAPPPGAYMEGVVASTGVKLTNVTTLGTAFLLGAMHRVATEAGWDLYPRLGQMRAALLDEQPAHSSLYSVVTDMSTGYPIQTDYLRAASRSWGFATAFVPDGGAGGQEPGATSYRADAAAAMVEGLMQLWLGRQNAPPCGY